MSKTKGQQKKNVNGCPKVNLVDVLFGIHFVKLIIAISFVRDNDNADSS